MLKRIGVITLCSALALLAAEPVATVTAGPDLKLNGKILQTAGAPNWPVADGDELVTGAAAAVLSFPDGARLTLAPNTKVVLRKCDRCIVQLFLGSVDYSKPTGSNFEMCALGHPVRPVAGSEGSVVVVSPEKVIVKVAGKEQAVTSGTCACNTGFPWAKVGMSGKKKGVILLIVGGGAATAATIAVAQGPKKSKKEK